MWLLASMKQHVCLQILLLSECSIAHLAFVWLFAGMDLLVLLQIPFLGKRLIANITRVHLGYGSVNGLISRCIQVSLFTFSRKPTGTRSGT